MRSWTDKHRDWVMQLKFEQRALEETLTDYAAEADHQRERVARLERAIDEAADKVAQMKPSSSRPTAVTTFWCGRPLSASRR